MTLQKRLTALMVACGLIPLAIATLGAACTSHFVSTEAGTVISTSALFSWATVLFVSTGVTVAAGGWWISGRIARPVIKLTEHARLLAQGTLDSDFRYTSSDELGDLADSMREVQQSIATMTRQTSTLVEDVRAGKLDQRAESHGSQGCYSTLLRDINDLLDAFSSPVIDARDCMTAVAQGDLTRRMSTRHRGEFGRLAHSINEAVSHLEQAIGDVARTTDTVARASDDVERSSQEIAEGSTEQASSLEEIASSLEEMTSMTRHTSENATQAKLLAQETRVSADNGKSAMERMSTAIEQIKNSSDQQAKIVRTIDEIAFQTNLLALNAAVEAARAGEAGKGFAVVAEEVRSLAQRSAEAARTTASMIEASVESSDNGVLISREVAAMLQQIYSSAQKTDDLVAEIAAASKEQSQGIDQVNTAIGQLDATTQSAAEASQTSAETAQTLARNVDDLRRLVKRFQLGNMPTATTRLLEEIHDSLNTTPEPKKAAAVKALQPVAAGMNEDSASEADEGASLIPFDDDDFGDF